MSCALCGQKSIKTSVVLYPCGDSGCADCVLRDGVCQVCARPAQSIADEVAATLLAAASYDPSTIHGCGHHGCKKDASDYCVDCGLMCETHLCAHQVCDVFDYSPLPALRCVCGARATGFNYENVPGCEPCGSGWTGVDQHATMVRAASTMKIFGIEKLCRLIGSRYHEVQFKSRERLSLAARVFAAAGREDLVGRVNDALKKLDSDRKEQAGDLLAIECRIEALRATSLLPDSHVAIHAMQRGAELLAAMVRGRAPVREYHTDARALKDAEVPAVRSTILELLLDATPFYNNRMPGTIRKVRAIDEENFAVLTVDGVCLVANLRSGMPYTLGDRVEDIASSRKTLATLVDGRLFFYRMTCKTSALEKYDCPGTTMIAVSGTYIALVSGTQVSWQKRKGGRRRQARECGAPIKALVLCEARLVVYTDTRQVTITLSNGAIVPGSSGAPPLDATLGTRVYTGRVELVEHSSAQTTQGVFIEVEGAVSAALSPTGRMLATASEVFLTVFLR